jgi:anti-anti-sigma factor
VSLTEPASEFTCHVQPDRDRVIVHPRGELDLTTVDAVGHELGELRDAGFERLVVDLDALTFIDSSGLQLLLDWTRLAREDGTSFELLEGPPSVMRVFDLSGTREAFAFVRRRRFQRGL